MKCFYHPDADAVGSCKNCQRGLCRVCAEHSQNSLACPSRCEEAVSKLDKLVTTNIRLTNASSLNLFVMPVVFLAIGLGFAFYAISNPAFHAFFILGGFAALFGAVRLYSVIRYLYIRNS
jgi:hypothetical protein